MWRRCVTGGGVSLGAVCHWWGPCVMGVAAALAIHSWEAAWIAVQTFSAVSGMSRWRMP